MVCMSARISTEGVDAIAKVLDYDPLLVLREAYEMEKTKDDLVAEAFADAALDPMALAAYRGADKNRRPKRPADEGA